MPSLILFDGVCNLCNGFVQFVIARDPRGAFQFGALQSLAARRILDRLDVAQPLPDSLVLIENGAMYTRSAAALRIVRRLTFPWPLASLFLVIPAVLRDAVYDLIAGRRYRWFGRRDQCMVPTPEIRSRFID